MCLSMWELVTSVEKTAGVDAKDFFKRKIDLPSKWKKIQPALQEKHAVKQKVVEMMSQKIQQLTNSWE